MLAGLWTILPVALSAAPLLPAVEAEGLIYEAGNANNGSGPLWCYGSTVLARIGEQVFASGMEVLPDQQPLHNTRWVLWQLVDGQWRTAQADPTGRQREPCPLGVFRDGRLLLTSNPTLTPPGTYSGAARPTVLVFDTAQPSAAPRLLEPRWEGAPAFTEHSYRGFCVDGPNQEALYFNNLGYDSIYWSFLDRQGQWSRSGRLAVPWGAEFEVPEPVRICYHNMALRDRAAHTLGVSDIIEPVKAWREYKLILNNGQKWDYDFRRLYYCYTPDITSTAWQPWVKVADCDATCGHITNLDLWLDAAGRAHLLWIESSVWNPKVRDKFFPEVPATKTLMYGLIEQGKVMRKVALLKGGERQPSQVLPGYARFQATPDGRLLVISYASGSADGLPINENRVQELLPDGSFTPSVRVPLRNPFTAFMTASERGGSAPSATLDLLGQVSGQGGIHYARIGLLNQVLADFEAAVEWSADGTVLALDGRPSRAVQGEIAEYQWQVGEQRASGPQVRLAAGRGKQATVALTVRDAAGHQQRATRTVNLPPHPSDFGLARWGTVLRLEAEQFAAEGGGSGQVRDDKLQTSGLSLSHSDAAGHWLEWECRVPTADRYYLLARYAVPTDTARDLTIDGQPGGELAFASTGGYGSSVADDWRLAAPLVGAAPLVLPLSAGPHRLRLTNRNGRGLNLDYLELVAATAPAVELEPAGWRLLEHRGWRYLAPLEGTLAPSRMRPDSGQAYVVVLGPQFVGDGVAGQPASRLELFENGQPLTRNNVHADIRAKSGLYSHWSTVVYFSASDGSDPRANGRRYTWRLTR
ncbi:MAG: hypothetical protein IT204_12140 [Fimbriimonadaceae bacterium]|nr:hypothetical protein [Fimbriimonadaceae bacterium]